MRSVMSAEGTNGMRILMLVVSMLGFFRFLSVQWQNPTVLNGLGFRHVVSAVLRDRISKEHEL